MAFGRKLKDMMIFNEGADYAGQATSLTLPKLTRKLEEFRGAGMDSAVKIDMGGEAMEAEWVCAGPMRDVLSQYGIMDLSGVQLRFVGNYQDDDSGAFDTVEVVMRGRHEEIDMGEAKPGEAGEFKVKTALAYYKLIWNGATLIEVDPLSMVLVVNGVDRLLERRQALGLF